MDKLKTLFSSIISLTKIKLLE